MSKTGRVNHRRGSRGRPKAERRIIVRGIRKDPPDLRKLSRAVIAIALHEAELAAEAKAAQEIHRNDTDTTETDPTTEAVYD